MNKKIYKIFLVSCVFLLLFSSKSAFGSTKLDIQKDIDAYKVYINSLPVQPNMLLEEQDTFLKKVQKWFAIGIAGRSNSVNWDKYNELYYNARTYENLAKQELTIAQVFLDKGMFKEASEHLEEMNLQLRKWNLYDQAANEVWLGNLEKAQQIEYEAGKTINNTVGFFGKAVNKIAEKTGNPVVAAVGKGLEYEATILNFALDWGYQGLPAATKNVVEDKVIDVFADVAVEKYMEIDGGIGSMVASDLRLAAGIVNLQNEIRTPVSASQETLASIEKELANDSRLSKDIVADIQKQLNKIPITTIGVSEDNNFQFSSSASLQQSENIIPQPQMPISAQTSNNREANEALKQPTPPQNCSDNTLNGQCSVNRPFFCENGELIQRASQCGCPQGQEKQTNNTCAIKPPIQTCSDGTAYNQCSTNKPKYCSNGYLNDHASACGCPLGQIAQGENCDVADIIEPEKDFSLSMRESITVIKGDTASQDISITMPSWNTDTLSFEVRDMPPYVSHYFTSANCKASCTTFLEIDAGSPDTPAGTYQVTVGTYGGPNITKSFELKIVERTPPSAPVLQATPISSSQIKLSWSDDAAYDDSLMIERRIEGNHDYAHIHGGQKRNLFSYVDSELNPNTRYCYRIYFTNDYVSSPNYSKEQCVTTLQDTPPLPQEEPDLTITSLRAPTTANVGNGTPMLSNVSITIANTGSVSAGRFRVEFYWSQDTVITVDDIPAASHFIPSGLGPRESKTGKELGRDIMVSIPASLSPGTYYLGAIIDDEMEVEENNEANNSRTADTGPIILSGPPQPPISTSPPDGFSYIYTIYNHEEPTLGKQIFEWQKRNPNDTVKGQIFNGEQCEGPAIDTLVTDTPWNSGYIMKDRLAAEKSYSWNLIGYSNGVPSAPSECRSFSVQAE